MAEQLAKATDPLVLADGTKIDPVSGTVVKDESPKPPIVEVPTHKEARDLVVRTRRALIDLPEPPKTMNGVALVLSYTLMGLADTEIAVAVGVDRGLVTAIKKSDAFRTALEHVVQGALEADEGSVKTVFHKHAVTAANRVIGLMQSENESVAMRAAQDTLDRSGNRPVDVHEHRHAVDGELRIKHIRAGDTPTFDVAALEEGEFSDVH